ncbi:MAG TPA: hypothetical protein VFD58_17795 [Blastocatellia bacterium]|nr:hypothetical protein [Blastocatellia bacterium]
MKKFFSVILLSAYAILCQRPLASTCYGPEHPCEEYTPSSTIFIGRAISGSQESEGVDIGGNKLKAYSGTVRFKVIVGFNKASAGQVVQVEVPKRCGFSCRCFSFREDEDYLVYSGEVNGGLTIGCCSRTRPLSQAGYDIQFLSRIPYISGASLSGTVTVSFRDQASGNDLTRQAGGTIVRVRLGDKTIETKTNDGGYYNLAGLQPGDYEVEVVPPNGYRAEQLSRKVSLCDKCCGGVSFYLKTEDAAIIKSILARERKPFWESLKRPPVLISLVTLIAASLAVVIMVLLLGSISRGGK